MKSDKSRIPKPFKDFMANYPEVGQTYAQLGHAVHNAGPIDQKTRELVKLAMSCGAQKEGAVHSHTRYRQFDAFLPGQYFILNSYRIAIHR